MHHQRVFRLVLPIAAAAPLLWLAAGTTSPRHAPRTAVASRAAATTAPVEATGTERRDVVQIFEATLDFVREISRSFERHDYAGAVVRLLVIVEVLIGALGVVSCVTVWGAGKADLVYRIVDVMGALFLVIALLLTASMLVWGFQTPVPRAAPMGLP